MADDRKPPEFKALAKRWHVDEVLLGSVYWRYTTNAGRVDRKGRADLRRDYDRIAQAIIALDHGAQRRLREALDTIAACHDLELRARPNPHIMRGRDILEIFIAGLGNAIDQADELSGGSPGGLSAVQADAAEALAAELGPTPRRRRDGTWAHLETAAKLVQLLDELGIARASAETVAGTLAYRARRKRNPAKKRGG